MHIKFIVFYNAEKNLFGIPYNLTERINLQNGDVLSYCYLVIVRYYTLNALVVDGSGGKLWLVKKRCLHRPLDQRTHQTGPAFTYDSPAQCKETFTWL